MKPTRKQLPHEAPLWVDTTDADYFITICCKLRGTNQIALPAIAEELLETIEHRNKQGGWYAHIALVMPDHVHFLLSFPESETRMQIIVSKWKEWAAKTLKIAWQRDFFEHRLRQEESFREKADYILANPVRAGLVKEPEEWPYVFITETY